MKQDQQSKRWRKRPVILLVSLLLLAGIAVCGTAAYLLSGSGPVANNFTPSKVTTTVQETQNGKIKELVRIQNTGDTTAYIRAAVVFTWQDAQGNIYGEAPKQGEDYTIRFDLEHGWVLGQDGFYYWTKPVPPKKSDSDSEENFSTGVLIEDCSPTEDAAPPEGYTLAVEIIGSGIQSVPSSVVVNSWGSVENVEKDGTLIIKEATGA